MAYLSATFDLPNGATATIARFATIETNADATVTTIFLNYYTDLSATLILWQSGYDVPSTVLESGTYPNNIYDWLISGSGPLNGATMLDDTVADIDDARMVKWVQIKAMRDAEEFNGCSTPLGLIDSDGESQQRVTSTLAFADLVGSTTFGVGWTMQDNSVIWHDYDAFHDLALVLGQHVSNAHSKAQALRAKLNLLSDIEDVEAFDVMTEWANLAVLTEEDEAVLTEAGLDLVA